MNKQISGKLFLGLRFSAFLGMAIVLIAFFLQGVRSIDLILFSVLGLFWFGGSLLVNITVADRSDHLSLRSAVFAMIDSYMLVSAICFVGRTPSVSVSVFGLYAFLATVFCGPLVGGVAAAAGFLAQVSAWLFKLGSLFYVAIACVISVLCGMAWRICIPVFFKSVAAVDEGSEENESESAEAEVAEPEQPVPAEAPQLAEDVEKLKEELEKARKERDEAQELAASLQEQKADEIEASPEKPEEVPAAEVLPPEEEPGPVEKEPA